MFACSGEQYLHENCLPAVCHIKANKLEIFGARGPGGAIGGCHVARKLE